MNARLTSSHVTAAAALLLLAAPVLGQTTGTSHPEALNDSITTDSTPQARPHYVKPSAGVPMQSEAAPVAQVPAALPHEREPLPAYSSDSRTHDGGSYAPAPSVQTASVRHNDAGFVVTDDVNSGVIVDVPTRANELPEGALLKAQLVSSLSTTASPVGSRFAASLTQEVRHYGKVILPQGTLVRGRVSAVHGGRRIGGAPYIRLQPESLLLPDGTTYPIAANVIDLDRSMDSKVDPEGAIVAKGHGKETLGVLGATTGTAAVTGALIGGGVGAAVGAGIGAGVGTIWWLKKDRQETLPSGTEIVFSLDRPLQFEPAQQ